MILIAGGTGTLGTELVRHLTGTGTPMRILTRDARRAAQLPVQIAVGDVRDPASIGRAVTGCTAVVSAVHGFLGGRGAGPEEIDDLSNAHLIQAAAEAGVQRFVLLSALGARPDHPMALHRAKYRAEQHLRGSGMSWTVLRPSAYLETWTAIIAAKTAEGGPALVFGRGANPINFVSVRDVAALTALALTEPALHDQTIDVPGPVNLTMNELARTLGATRTRHIPRAALWVMAVAAAPVKPALARQAAAALIMDTTDMTADATELHQRFPHITWQPDTPTRRTPDARSLTAAVESVRATVSCRIGRRRPQPRPAQWPGWASHGGECSAKHGGRPDLLLPGYLHAQLRSPARPPTPDAPS